MVIVIEGETYYLGRHGCDEEGAYLHFNGTSHDLARTDYRGTCYETFEEQLDIEIYLEDDYPDIAQRLQQRLIMLGIPWDGDITEDLDYLNMSDEELLEEFDMEHIKVARITQTVQGYRMVFDRFEGAMKFSAVELQGIYYARLEPTEQEVMETGNEVSVFDAADHLACRLPPLVLRMQQVILVMNNRRLSVCVPKPSVEADDYIKDMLQVEL